MKISKTLSISISKSTMLFSMIFICFTLSLPKAYAQNSTCFSKVIIEPSFIAFTTTKESKLADWYQSTFGLKTVKKFAFPDGTVNGLLMQKGEFVVEVFNRDDALQASDYVQNSKPEQWRGVMKFGIYTNANLPMLKQCLINQGVQAGRIYNDTKLNIDLLQVIDPEQNILEIISRTKSL
jgi:hypothetical protein